MKIDDNIKQVIAEYGLSSYDPAKIIRELCKIRAQLHPDPTGGKFNSPEVEEKYMLVNEAIKTLREDAHEAALVPFANTTELVKILSGISEYNNIAVAERKLSDLFTKKTELIGRRSIAPKITGSIALSLLGAIFLFPDSIQKHPLLKTHINIYSKSFILIWLALMALGVMFFILTWLRESSEKDIYARLKLESFQNHLFQRFLEEYGFQDFPDRVFCKSDFVEFLRIAITPMPRSFWLLYARSFQLDLELAENLANVLFVRAANRELIVAVPKAGSLEQYYRLLDQNLDI